MKLKFSKAKLTSTFQVKEVTGNCQLDISGDRYEVSESTNA